MISIIIPNYNQGQFLLEAIESALNQTYDDFEVIVVNDGSTDNSLEIVRKYPVRIIDQTNKGLASARNTGIMNSKGDYLLFLDADDILLENCLEVIARTIKETNSEVISPSFKCFGLNNDQIILIPNPTIEDFKQGNRVGYCSAIKRETLLEVGGYNPKMVWGAEDYDLWFDLLKRGKKITTIPEILWLYRTKHSSMWTETQKHQKEFMEQIYKNHPQIFNA